MFSGAGGAVARRRRDVRSVYSLLSTLWVLWSLVFSFTQFTSHYHTLLPSHFMATVNPDGDRVSLPASLLFTSPGLTHRVQKLAKVEATASNWSKSLKSEICLLYSHGSGRSKTISGFHQRKGLRLTAADELYSALIWVRSLKSKSASNAPLSQQPAISFSTPIFISPSPSRHSQVVIVQATWILGFSFLGLAHFDSLVGLFWSIFKSEGPFSLSSRPTCGFSPILLADINFVNLHKPTDAPALNSDHHRWTLLHSRLIDSAPRYQFSSCRGQERTFQASSTQLEKIMLASWSTSLIPDEVKTLQKPGPLMFQFSDMNGRGLHYCWDLTSSHGLCGDSSCKSSGLGSREQVSQWFPKSSRPAMFVLKSKLSFSFVSLIGHNALFGRGLRSKLMLIWIQGLDSYPTSRVYLLTLSNLSFKRKNQISSHWERPFSSSFLKERTFPPFSFLETTVPLVHVISPLMAEALVVLNALSSARARGWQRILIYSYPHQLVRAISSKSMVKEIYGLLSDIDHLSTCFSELGIVVSPRSKNRYVDSLAKEALMSCNILG